MKFKNYLLLDKKHLFTKTNSKLLVLFLLHLSLFTYGNNTIHDIRNKSWNDVFTEEVYNYYHNSVFNNETDYSSIIYIDPEYQGTDNNGSLEKPFKNLMDVDKSKSNVAYLIKRGTTQNWDSGLEFTGDNIMIGAYGDSEGAMGHGNRPYADGGITLFGDNCLLRDIEINSVRFGKTSSSENGDNGKIFNSKFHGTAELNGFGIGYMFVGIEVLNKATNGIHFIQKDLSKDNNIEVAYSHIHQINQNWLPDGNPQNIASGDGIQIRDFRGNYHYHHNIIDKSDVGNKFCLIVNPNAGTEDVTGLIENNFLYAPFSYPDGGNVMYFGNVSNASSSKKHTITIKNNVIIGHNHNNNNWTKTGIYTNTSEVKVYGNIFIDLDTFAYLGSGEFGENEVYNNTFVETKSGNIITVASSGGLSKFYNNIIPDGTNANPQSQGNNINLSTLNTDELFVDYDNDDFNILENSIAIDAGIWESWMDDDYLLDISGTSVPHDNTLDIGALQFNNEQDLIAPPYTLNLNITGNGSVDVSPLKDEYDEGETVTLTAEPDENWVFDEWGGNISGQESTVNITMNDNKSITATFEEVVTEGEGILQSASGNGTVSLPFPTTEGSLLVAVLAHRQDEQTPDIPEGFTLREVIQNGNDKNTRHGILICDKIADGTETSFDLNFGTSSDIGGIIMEFDIQNAVYYDANSNTSGSQIPTAFSENVPQPQTAYLSVAGAVSRNGNELTSWDNSFSSSLSKLDQMGMAARIDNDYNLPTTVSVENSGDQGAIVVGTWTIGEHEQEEPTFGINTSVVGNGTVALNPDKTAYDENENVTITAIPDSGWEFTEWSGDISGNINPQSININSDMVINAHFEEIIHQVTFNVSHDDNSIPNATITLNGTTNPEGDYIFDGINTGNCNYTVSADGYYDVNESLNISEDTTIDVEMSAIPPENFEVVFSVNDEDGNPINDATITLGDNSNPQGEYTFGEVSDGTYNYTISADGYYDVNETVNISEDTNIDVELTTIPPETFEVVFNITDINGSPISNALVTFDEITQNPGDYTFTGIEEGQYSYTIAAEGFIEMTNQVTVNSDKQIDIQLTAIAPEKFDVTFSVKDHNQNDVTNAVITLGEITNDPGDYLFNETESGNYHYTITAEGFQDVNVYDLQIIANTHINITLNPITEETYTVNFNVMDNLQNPIENATVTFNDITNPEGNYAFTGVEAGNYDYSIEADGYNTFTVSNATVSGNSTFHVTLIEDTPSLFTVNFSVNDQENNPVENAIITFNGQTNTEGNYVFEEIAAGTYSYSVSAPGYMDVNMTNISVTGNTNFNVVMMPVEVETYTVTFNIEDQNNTFIENATITFDGETLDPGNYIIEDIEEGSYAYSITAPGYKIFNETVSVNQNTLINAYLSPVPPETYDVDFVINDDQDNPVENATITFQGTTNPQGNYSFSEIEYGTWNYTVSADGFTDQSGSVLIDQDTEVNVNLVPVEPENYTVTFNVKDDSGNDIPDASINFNGISNPAGDYVFPEIEQGTYSYNIIADGFYTINDEITIDQDAQIMINMTPIPDETFTVVFEISDQQGQAVNNAFITLDDIINPQGIYTFQGLEAGNYDYTVKAEGFHDKNATVNFDQDTIISLSLTPLPPDTYNVNFVVNDPEGQPINNAVITFDGDTNPQGDYSFSEIEQGNYNYSVVAEGYKPYNNSTVVEANTNLQVTLQVQDQESDGFTTFFTILDEQDNNQIEDAVVTFNGQTNPAGDYRFENVPEGVNYFSIHADGYESVEDQLIVIVMDNMNILNRMVPLPPENIVVDARANPEGFAFVSGAGDYPVNDTVSLSTTPISQNYRFIGWMEDGEMVSTEEAYIFLADDHRTIIANYEYIPEEYAIETSLSIENSGIIDGAGQYEKNETVVLEMHLHADFIFKGWMNQAGQIVSRQNPYVFDAVRDLKLTGITEEIIDEDEKTVKAFPNPSTGNITLTNPFDENATLHILNSDGVVIQTRPVNSNNNRIDLRELPPGIYFLKIYFENEVATEKIILR